MNQKAEDLLVGKLQIMYEQAQLWTEEIKFYEEELSFLNGLIVEKINTTTTEDLDHREIYRNMDAILYKLSDELITQINKHAKDLVRLIDQRDFSSNHGYSKNHIHFLEKMTLLQKDIKKLKKELYEYIKDHPCDLDFDEFLNEL